MLKYNIVHYNYITLSSFVNYRILRPAIFAGLFYFLTIWLVVIVYYITLNMSKNQDVKAPDIWENSQIYPVLSENIYLSDFSALFKGENRPGNIRDGLMCHQIGRRWFNRQLLASEVAGNGETSAALGATTCKHFATILSGHSFAESVLVNSLSVGRLESSFHCGMMLYYILQSDRVYSKPFTATLRKGHNSGCKINEFHFNDQTFAHLSP